MEAAKVEVAQAVASVLVAWLGKARFRCSAYIDGSGAERLVDLAAELLRVDLGRQMVMLGMDFDRRPDVAEAIVNVPGRLPSAPAGTVHYSYLAAVGDFRLCAV